MSTPAPTTISDWASKLVRAPCEIVPNSGGGDCLFISISQAYIGEIDAVKLRKDAAGRITQEEFRAKQSLPAAHGAGTLEQYCQIQATPGVWSDAETVGHIEEVLGVDIIVLHQPESGVAPYVYPRMQQQQDQQQQRRFIMIAHTGNNHYQLVRLKNII